MSNTYYKFWNHISGETYAISFDQAGDISGVCGPLHYSERDVPLNDFEFQADDIDWVVENSGDFRDTTTIEEHARIRFY